MAGQSSTDLDQAIGAAIRARRELVSMNQTALGRGVGVTFQQIQKYERGVNRVSASTLVRMAEVLGCATTELLGGVEPGPLSDTEATLLRFWKALTPRQQEVSLALVRQFAEP